MFDHSSINFSSFLNPARIVFLDISEKKEALKELASNIATSPHIKNRDALVLEIFKREELMTTAIGGQIAIPHARLASVNSLVVSVGISKRDILDYIGMDGLPVRILFMIAASPSLHLEYLKTIAFFSFAFKNKAKKNKLLNAKNAEEAYSILFNND